MALNRSVGIVFFAFMWLFSCDLKTYERGRKIYEKHCQNCHQAQGEGIKKLIPSIHTSTYLKDGVNQFPCLIKMGKTMEYKGPDGYVQSNMPAKPQLDATAITNLLNYLRHEFDAEEQEISETQVKEWLNACKTD